MTQENSGSANEATQGRETASGKPLDLWWVEASIWTDRMVSALGNGVKGGKWFSLVDKVIRPTTLATAWRKVAGTKGLRGWTARAWSGSRPARSFIFRNFMRI